MSLTPLRVGPFSNAIDFVDLLQFLPTRMRARGRKLHDDLITVYGQMVADVERRMEKDESQVPDCLVKTLIATREAENLDHEDICMLSAVFTLGGVHSVCLMLTSFYRPSNSVYVDARDHSVVHCGYGQIPHCTA